MTSNVINHKDYTQFKDSYQLVLPLNLEGLIPEDDSVRLLSHVLEGLDYTELYSAYSSKGRKPALEPVTMFKILVYAYSQNVYSSREIEKSCRRDINFRWLLAGVPAPDHSTIDRFRHFYAASAIVRRQITVGANCKLKSRLLPNRLCSLICNCTYISE